VILFEVVDAEPAPAAEAEETGEPAHEDLGREAGEEPAGEPGADDVAAEADVSRHGAGAGSRAAALSAIALLTLAALLILWWSIR